MNYKVKQVTYIDSAIDSGQTDEIQKPIANVAVGFVIYEDRDCIVLAQEIIGKDYRGQLSIPKVAVL